MTRPPATVLSTACAAVAITVAGVLYAWSTRPAALSDADLSPPRDELMCGTTACRSVAEAVVVGDEVEVLAGQGSGYTRTSGTSGRYIFELAVAQSGAELNDESLSCVDAETSVCLVRGKAGTEELGEVLVRRGAVWTKAPRPYVSSGGHLGLHDVDGDGVVDVVAVQRACPAGQECLRRFAQVFTLAGETGELGCTAIVAEPEALPGWPIVRPPQAGLRPCG
ncbi:hypothetical protein [Saccharothrix coeruleofusca]|uniref:hypothetical protein n=1 Tax=Saccharothrix coeruleofusca TaxID=33919 RepID=UPI00166FED4F|nr:hypothetical protein [Saccharothrix coeruleofusca]